MKSANLKLLVGITIYLFLSSGALYDPLYGSAKYGNKVPMGMDYLRAADTCVLFGAKLEARDFFNGLRASETPTGREFRKRSRRVETFPEKLTIAILASVGKCTTRGETERRGANGANIRVDESFMESLRFEGFWKRGFDMKEADLGLVSQGRRPSPTPLSSRAEWWQYQLQVRSHDVPLSDALVIIARSADGTRVARFSVRL